MKKVLAAAALVASLAQPAAAHRLDEYLQAALISVERNRIHVELRLAPGVAVVPIVLAGIDTNADGAISPAEQAAYAETVRRDLSLTTDGESRTPRLVTSHFPPVEEMKEGRGEIQLEFDAELRPRGTRRTLTFENRHLGRISAYLVNSLIPRDPGIQIASQNRNESQSVYQLGYAVAGAPTDWSAWAFLGAMAVLLTARVVLLKRGAGCHPARRLVIGADRS